MSKYYAESNNESTRALFAKRIVYRTQPELQRRPVVNFSQGGEKFLYGRVSPGMLPMQLPYDAPITKIRSANCSDERKPQQALDFVVHAFDEMCNLFNRKAQAAIISATDPYLTNLKAYKAYESPDKLYTTYTKTFQQSAAAVLKQDPTPINNFTQFMERLTQVIEKGALSFPFTKPAYIKSKLCPMRCSGLVIEIADLDYDNDVAKTQFINSPNWEFFVEACNQYGFMIDLNVPWRLVADIDSVGMNNFSRLYKRPDLGAILGLYTNVQIGYLPIFIESLNKIYNEAKRPLYNVEDCIGDNLSIDIELPPTYTARGLLGDFKLEYFLKYYFRIRFAEEESRFTPSQQERIIAETLQLYRHGPPERAINIFEQILNKTFDYAGSLSYTIERKRQVENDDLSVYR
jgi:hypothetical protein